MKLKIDGRKGRALIAGLWRAEAAASSVRGCYAVKPRAKIPRVTYAPHLVAIAVRELRAAADALQPFATKEN